MNYETRYEFISNRVNVVFYICLVNILFSVSMFCTWFNATEINNIQKDIIVLKTVLEVKKIMPHDLAK